MTIKDIMTIIECHKYIEKAKFKGLRVAVDFLIYWHAAHIKASFEEIGTLPLVLLPQYNKERILTQSINYFLDFIMSIVQYEMIPIIIFDGDAFPLKQKHAAVKRKKDKDRSKERLAEMNKLDLSTLSEKDIKTYRSLFCQSIIFDRKQVCSAMKQVLSHIGLPWLQCVTEAEHLAVALCKEGYAFAAYTSDSDVVALQCPFTILKEGDENDRNAPFFKTLQYKNVLQTLALSQEQMTDLCILCSCDYNERISIVSKKTGKNKNVGVKTALKLIQEHKSIEGICENETVIEKEKLEHTECRNIFKSFSVKELCPRFIQNFEQSRVGRLKPEHNGESENSDTNFHTDLELLEKLDGDKLMLLISLIEQLPTYVPRYDFFMI